jgi:hypothetical protein
VAGTTLATIKQRIRTLNRERPGTDAYKDLDEVFNDDVKEGANELAGDTDCLFIEFATDLTENVVDYCAPNIYKLKTVGVVGDDGRYAPLPLIPIARRERRSYGEWRNDDGLSGVSGVGFTSDPPWRAILNGVNSITLEPIPSTTRASALIFTGFAKPGEFWTYNQTTGAGNTLSDTDECPLPTWAITCLGYYVAWKRADRYGIKNAAGELMAPKHYTAYRDRLGDVATKASEYGERASFYDSAGAGRWGWWK